MTYNQADAIHIYRRVFRLQLVSGSINIGFQDTISNSCVVQVQHPNCISLYAVYITPRKVYLVTELVTGGELLDR